MTSKYFAGCETVAEIKARFRDLMMAHHPDRHQGEETKKRQNDICAAIIALYHDLLKSSHGQKSTSRDEQTGQEREHTYHYNRQYEQSVIDKIDELLKLKIDDIEILLIGTWVWVTGNTRPIKDQLKGLGMRWHGKRLCWYWRPYNTYSRFNEKASLGDLARVYGVERFQNEKEQPRQQPKARPALAG